VLNAAKPVAIYFLKTYRRTKRDGTCGELLNVVEIDAPHLAAAQIVVEDNHLEGLDFRHDFAILADDNGHPFVTLWLSGPNA